MSSHHIIREAQEPALLILNPEPLSDPDLASILEWSPTIISMADMFSRLIESDLKVDVVVGSQEQLSLIDYLLESQAPVQAVPAPEPEDPLLTTLKHLKEKKQQALNILCSPEQLQEELLQLLASQDLINNIVLLDGKERWALCRSGYFSKWLPAGEKLRIKPATSQVHINSRGFTEDLNGATMREAHTLQPLHSGRLHIEASGPVWIIESLT